MKIQIFVTYCPRCEVFIRNLKDAMKELNIDEEIEEISVEDAMARDLRSSSALIIDGELKHTGEVLSVEEFKKILKESM